MTAAVLPGTPLVPRPRDVGGCPPLNFPCRAVIGKGGSMPQPPWDVCEACTSSTADFRFQPAAVPEPVHPQYDRHQKINPAAPLDLLGRQSKGKDKRHEPDA